MVRKRVTEKHGKLCRKECLEIGKARMLQAEGTTSTKLWSHDSVWSAWDIESLFWAVKLER